MEGPHPTTLLAVGCGQDINRGTVRAWCFLKIISKKSGFFCTVFPLDFKENYNLYVFCLKYETHTPPY